MSEQELALKQRLQTLLDKINEHEQVNPPTLAEACQRARFLTDSLMCQFGTFVASELAMVETLIAQAESCLP
jgi:hypothetical protein